MKKSEKKGLIPVEEKPASLEKIAVDVSCYDLSQRVRDYGKVFPYRYSKGFSSHWWKEEEINTCPSCGDRRRTVCLGHYLSCDVWKNVFACERCQLAWAVWDQTGEPTSDPDSVRNLVRTFFDPEFTPDNEKEDRCENCALFRPGKMAGAAAYERRQCICEADEVTFPSNSPCDEFVPKEKENRKVAGEKEADVND